MKTYGEVLFLVMGYSTCSALLVVINKWALVHFPFGATLTALQFGTAAITVRLLGAFGVVELDALEFSKVWAFLPAVILFYISVASNLKLLQYANVDTFIVVRACTPLATLCVDLMVSNIPWPSRKSVACLVLIVVAACGYVATDEGFAWNAYGYALLYLCAMTTDQVVIKKVVMNVKLTRWGLVYYNNLIAACMMPVGSFLTGEYHRIMEQYYSGALWTLVRMDVACPVIASCVFGVGISYFGLNTRRALTATAFTVLGVVCKFGTILVNTAVWDRHAQPVGIGCACVCIAGGILYQQTEKEKVLTPMPAAKVEEQKEKEKPPPPVPPAAASASLPGGTAAVRSASRGN